MYKLLLATSRPETLDAFNGIPSWEAMGFRKPRIVAGAQEAMEALENYHVDAIAFDLPAEEDAQLMAYLTEHEPILPIFEACRKTTGLVTAVKELRGLLNRTHADFSNDDFGEKDMLQLCRHDFLRSLLGGQVKTRKDVEVHLRLLRSKMDPHKPCVVLDMAACAGDDFLSGRWHYGSERLEVALRNFFGVELDGMRIVASVMQDETIRLLCCPMLGAQVETDSITALVTQHAEGAMEHVREYLDLDLHITNIHVLPMLTMLARERV